MPTPPLRPRLSPLLPLLIFALLSPLPLCAQTTQNAPETQTIYQDPAAQSSATVTQILPNSQTTQLILTNVTLIQIKQETIVINWGSTATTLLPRQFVLSLTVNKRTTPPNTPAQ